jgi:hypothetical protein
MSAFTEFLNAVLISNKMLEIMDLPPACPTLILLVWVLGILFQLRESMK